MNEIFQFLKSNPLVLVILLAWIAGALGNIVKAVKKSRERAAKAQQPTRVEPPVVRHEPRRTEPTRTEPQPIRSEEIAAEMRRILRQQAEPTEGDGRPAPRRQAPPPLPPRPRSEPRPVARPRNVVLPERPPAPVMPSTSSRRLSIQVDPHVGEAISRRSSVRSGHVGEHTLGQLGGRVHGVAQRRTAASRYALDDLKRVIVLNEIIGLPLALRGSGGREL